MHSMQHRLLPRGNRTERASSDSWDMLGVCTVSVDSHSDDKRHSHTVMPSCKRKEEGKIRHTDHIGYERPAGCMLFRSDRGFTQRALQHSLSRTAAARARGRVVLGLSSSAQCRVNAGAATPPATGECSSDCAPSSRRRTLGQLQPQSEWSPGLAAAELRKRSLQPAFSADSNST